MIRRTLEALCEDQGAKGATLVKRIEALGGQVGLPPAMISALHDVRLLGNDAAHVEARTYAEVGKQEVEAAIEVAKFILASTYQADAALKALQVLRADAPAEPAVGGSGDATAG
jgi:hypothetical protein